MSFRPQFCDDAPPVRTRHLTGRLVQAQGSLLKIGSVFLSPSTRPYVTRQFRPVGSARRAQRSSTPCLGDLRLTRIRRASPPHVSYERLRLSGLPRCATQQNCIARSTSSSQRLP